MEALARLCQSCKKPMNGGVYRAAHICPHCYFEHEGGKKKSKKIRSKASPVKNDGLIDVQKAPADETPIQPAPAKVAAVKAVAAAEIKLTAKTAVEQGVIEVLMPVDANCVLNLKLTPDLFEKGKFLGTKSEKVQAALKQGKKHALAQLRSAAQEIGANMVTDVSVKNAMKAVDSKLAKITVKATGTGVVAEVLEEAVEA